MNKICFLTVYALVVISTKAIADISIPPFKQVAWESRTYRTTLPEPFGKVVVDLRLDNEDSDVEMMVVKIDGKIRKVDPAYIVGVSNPDELEITTVVIDHKNQSEPKQFKISFEYGVPQRKLISDGAGCNDSCYEWTRKSMVITIDQNYSVSVEKH